MHPTAVAAIVFACLFGSTLLGTFLRAAVPAPHLSQDSRDVVKLAIGLLATMAALVLGLLTASAKHSFDVVDNEVQQTASNVVLLDRALAEYGPETKDMRDSLRRALALRIALTWSEYAVKLGKVDAAVTTPSVEAIENSIRNLAPQNDAQRGLQSRALHISGDLMKTRWLVYAQAGNSVPIIFLVVLVFWLGLLFVSFGLLAPRNVTILATLSICALAVSGSIFLILEMSRPLEGLIQVSSTPLRYALAHLGQ